MKRAIGGKGLSSHINGVTAPPGVNDPSYAKWEEMKKSRPNRSRNGGSRATAAAASSIEDRTADRIGERTANRATSANNTAGNVGRSSEIRTGRVTDADRGDEKATASVSVARAWTERKTSPAVLGAGKLPAAEASTHRTAKSEGTRVLGKKKEAGARVGKRGGE